MKSLCHCNLEMYLGTGIYVSNILMLNAKIPVYGAESCLVHKYRNPSLIPMPSHCPVFDHLQYAK